MKRLDAYLSSLGYCTRSEVTKFLKMHDVSIKGERVFKGSLKCHHGDVLVDNEPLDDETLVILMNKPSGVICSHDDAGVLIYSLLPQRWQRRNPKISTIGRLDADTTGAILLSDDGALNHKFTSPKKHVSKVYEVTLAQELRGDEKELFESGELVLKGEDKALLPAKMQILSPTKVLLEIFEGKYHQVKRMFGAVGNRVTALHRVSFNGLSVEHLKAGEYELIKDLTPMIR